MTLKELIEVSLFTLYHTRETSLEKLLLTGYKYPGLTPPAPSPYASQKLIFLVHTVSVEHPRPEECSGGAGLSAGLLGSIIRAPTLPSRVGALGHQTA